jgi:hypothetical protein
MKTTDLCAGERLAACEDKGRTISQRLDAMVPFLFK